MRLGWILLALAITACAPQPEADLHLSCEETTLGDFDCVAFDADSVEFSRKNGNGPAWHFAKADTKRAIATVFNEGG